VGAILVFAVATATCLAFVAPDRTGARPVQRREQTFEAIITGQAEILPLVLAVVFLVLTGLAAVVASRVWVITAQSPDAGANP